MMSASTGTSSFGAVDGRAGGAGQRRDRPDVIEVAVREQDRLDRDAELRDGGLEAVGLVARVDHQRAIGAVAAGDPAVLGDGPDGEAAGVHQRLASPAAARLRCARV
jgi:hypothetical protein